MKPAGAGAGAGAENKKLAARLAPLPYREMQTS